MSRTARFLTGALAVSVLASAVPASAHASFPGRNGGFALAMGCGLAPHLEAFSSHGRDLGPITPPCQSISDVETDVYLETTAPAWSPDGARLLATQGSGLVTMGPDGGDVAPVPPADFADPPMVNSTSSDGSFAPDGRHIVFSRTGAVWSEDLLTGQATRLAFDPACRVPGHACTYLLAPRWSPRGARIVFQAQSAGGGRGRPGIRPGLWVMSARTGRLLRRVASNGQDADFSPDGRQLAYHTPFSRRPGHAGTTGGDLYVVDVNGRHRRRLLGRAHVARLAPAFSPDGRSIAWINLRIGGGPEESASVRPSLWATRLGRRLRAAPAGPTASRVRRGGLLRASRSRVAAAAAGSVATAGSDDVGGSRDEPDERLGGRERRCDARACRRRGAELRRPQAACHRRLPTSPITRPG